MAGLDRPTSGQLFMNGVDVTGVPVRERNISMVYQQFINYPNLTVYENIASPLRLARLSESVIRQRVQEIAELLHIEPYLQRLPLQLSGGQQQRTAMARALVKESQIILFDEPLVNLDYKLREELRTELRSLFKERNCIAVYATTEPNEALALSGNTAVLHEGKLLQMGPTEQVYHKPLDIITAEMFSEPPINIVHGRVSDTEVTFDETVHFQLNSDLRHLTPGDYKFGVRASHVGLVPHADDDLELPVKVELAEISGSETFLHVKNPHFDLVLHLSGVHEYNVDKDIKIYFPTHKLYAFDTQGQLVHAPHRVGG
jgi:glycerol transport system ATP-binding protein